MSLAGFSLWVNQDILLYHGTTEDRVQSVLDGIDVTRGKRLVDFGRGFYTTTSYDQALEHGNRVTRKTGYDAAVIEFAVSRDRLASLDCIFFVRGDPEANDYWSFVECCRMAGGNHMRLYGSPWYDVVAGPVAGNWKEKKSTKNPMDQISFHTPSGARALDQSRKTRVL